MTLMEAIHEIDAAKPNTCPVEEKRRWISQLDWKVYGEIMESHEGTLPSFSGYEQDQPADPVLLIPDSHREVYRYWLEAQIDYANGELTRYNNAITNYNTAYRAFRNHYNRRHRPKGVKRRYF